MPEGMLASDGAGGGESVHVGGGQGSHGLRYPDQTVRGLAQQHHAAPRRAPAHLLLHLAVRGRGARQL